jgi:sugar lactone lactonase YvrE
MPRRSHLIILLSLYVLILSSAACVPIQPVVRDGAGAMLPVNNKIVSEVKAITDESIALTIYDSTPDPDGNNIYFTARGQAEPGVYMVSIAGGASKALLIGKPLINPRGLAVSSDGKSIFVADADAGCIWVLSNAGGDVVALKGSEGVAAVGVDVRRVANGSEQVYFSGTKDGKPGVWMVGVKGGQASVIAEGAPLIAPMGIAVTNDGTVYMVDQQAAGHGLGSVFCLNDGRVEKIATNFRAGYLAGAALTSDDSALLVSALDVQSATAQVLVINLATQEEFVVTKVISANHGSGGIHRAHNVNLFSWADYIPQDIQKPGHIYIVKP